MLSTFSMQTISYSPVTSYTSVTSGSLTRLWVTFSSSLDSTNRFRKTRTSFAIVDSPVRRPPYKHRAPNKRESLGRGRHTDSRVVGLFLGLNYREAKDLWRNAVLGEYAS